MKVTIEEDVGRHKQGRSSVMQPLEKKMDYKWRRRRGWRRCRHKQGGRSQIKKKKITLMETSKEDHCKFNPKKRWLSTNKAKEQQEQVEDTSKEEYHHKLDPKNRRQLNTTKAEEEGGGQGEARHTRKLHHTQMTKLPPHPPQAKPHTYSSMTLAT